MYILFVNIAKSTDLARIDLIDDGVVLLAQGLSDGFAVFGGLIFEGVLVTGLQSCDDRTVTENPADQKRIVTTPIFRLNVKLLAASIDVGIKTLLHS